MAVTPQTRAVIRRALRPADYEIVWTANASEAVEASARYRPDLLLLDLDPPLRRTWRIFERLRTANPDVPVVVLTEHKSAYDGALPEHGGAVLQKPVGAAVLADTVNSLLRREMGGTAPSVTQRGDLRNVTTESEVFRAMLLERYRAPYAFSPSYRHWGINE